MENLGHFKQYKPTGEVDGLPVFDGVIYLKNEREQDWHSFQKGDLEGWFVLVDVNSVVVGLSEDLSTLTPTDCDVFRLEGGVLPKLGWILVEGNFQEPILPPAPLATITKRQFQLEMIELEKDDDLEEIIAAMPLKEQKKIRAELDANEYHFDSPFVSQLAVALGFSDEEKGQFWREAALR